MPSSSRPFWVRMGFSLDSLPGKHAYMVLAKTVELPAGLPRVKVRISFFPEGVLYDKVKPAPLSVWEPEAVRLLDGTIELGQRVVGFQRSGDRKSTRLNSSH